MTCYDTNCKEVKNVYTTVTHLGDLLGHIDYNYLFYKLKKNILLLFRFRMNY